MKKVIFILIALTPFLLSLTCSKNGDCHKIISFVNNSTQSIYVGRSLSIWPDTNLYSYDYNPLYDSLSYKINANQRSNGALQSSACYEGVMSSPKSDTIMVYVFDAQVLETTPWDTVTANNMYLKRYDLSLQDLQNSNWTITYP